MSPSRQRQLYAERRAAKRCTKCTAPSTTAVCVNCAPVRMTRAEWLAADRREEWLALSYDAALRRVR